MKLPYNQSFHVHQKQEIIIIWCAKAACTTVNYMFFEHENLLKKALKTSSWIHTYRKEYQQIHSTIRDYAIFNYSNSKYIQFSVNPYRRAVSSYIHGMKSNYINDSKKNISFQKFLEYLNDEKIEPNSHHNLQTFYKNNYDKINVVHMENMKHDLKKINNKFKLHYKPYSNQNVKIKSNKFNRFIGKDNWDTIKDNIPNDYTLFYNAKNKRLVERLYKEDIKNLGYTWEMFIEYEERKKSI